VQQFSAAPNTCLCAYMIAFWQAEVEEAGDMAGTTGKVSLE